MPFFSVVLPTYNRGHMLPAAIKSMISQSYENWELIIVDDGSTDNTKEVVLGFQDERIIYQWQENQERSAARNNGIAQANGTYICFLDSDDFYLPSHLSSLHAQIEKDNYPEAVFMSGLLCKDEKGKTLSKIDALPEVDHLPTHILQNYCSINSQSLAVHKSIFQNHKFDIRFSLWEDTHLWTRVLNDYPLKRIAEHTIVLCVHKNSGVVQGIENVSISSVLAYRSAVLDLVHGTNALFSNRFDLVRRYLDTKLRMYLYYARQNRQFTVAIQVCLMALKNKPSAYLMKELIKIPLNFIGIGLNRSLALGHTMNPDDRKN